MCLMCLHKPGAGVHKEPVFYTFYSIPVPFSFLLFLSGDCTLCTNELGLCARGRYMYAPHGPPFLPLLDVIAKKSLGSEKKGEGKKEEEEEEEMRKARSRALCWCESHVFRIMRRPSAVCVRGRLSRKERRRGRMGCMRSLRHKQKETRSLSFRRMRRRGNSSGTVKETTIQVMISLVFKVEIRFSLSLNCCW